MTESQSSLTKIILPVTVTLSTLPTFQFVSPILPDSNHEIAYENTLEYDWGNSNYSNCVSYEYDEYSTIVDFASDFVNELKDIPSDFAAILNEEFWNLV
jgi:hypothetical protein